MYHFIVNPAAKSGKGKLIWEKHLQPYIEAHNISYTISFSEKKGDITRLAKSLSQDVSAYSPNHPKKIVVLGGDGTLNELINGLTNIDHIAIGYIPTGSGNDFARDLRISKKPIVALQHILQSTKYTYMDRGSIHLDHTVCHPFIISCGIGFDAAVCEALLHSTKKELLNRIGLGKLAYLGIALGQLFKAPQVPASLTLDNHPPLHMDGMLLTAGMIHRYEGGGFMFCPNAKWNDGKIDLCIVNKIAIAKILFALPTAFIGKHGGFREIDLKVASNYKIHSQTPLWIHVDGEIIGQSQDIEVSCVPKAFRIIL